MQTAIASDRYISRRRAAIEMGVSQLRVMQLAAAGTIGTRHFPGLPDRYDAGDVAALVAQAERPARSELLAASA